MSLCLLALLAVSLWLANGSAMLRALPEAVRIWRMPAVMELPVPVQGVRAKRIADTWGGARSGGRRHEGTDIFAKRGTPVTSATRGIVVRIGDYGIGGKHVWVLGPGGERHYYAHLDGWAPGLRQYRVVRAGDFLGFVGDTGNARGTPPHLHYGIYGTRGATNPYPRLHDAPAR
ncbi:M23 family metallopeptidase [Thermomonas sp. HDW16]|nr:M23 family metallopeptidase [Thermomonas sp. HDW16]